MSAPEPIKTPRFHRQAPSGDGPDRSAGALYRMVGEDTGLAGIPLDSVEAAAIAAVRTGYRVAEAQIDRLRKVGDRARGVGQKLAGEEAEAQAIDQADRLLSKSMLAGLSWIEGVAAEPGSPWHRFLVAQYRLLGGALNLNDGPRPQPAPERPLAPGRASPRKAAPAIVHTGEVRRRVVVVGFDMDHAAGAAGIDPLAFYHAVDLEAAPISGALLPGTRTTELHLHLKKLSPTGVWSAAVCTSDGRQVGSIQIQI